MNTYELDIHTHTIASGHGSHATITDMAKAAAAKGLRLLGISDHGPATAGGGKPSYFRGLPQTPKKRLGIEMLYGAEANIMDNNGTLDLDDSILKHLDYTIASLHPAVKPPGTKAENTKAYIAAVKNPYVQIIGHCDDSRYPVDYHALITAAMQYHAVFEINAASLRPDGYRGDTRQNNLTIVHLCKHYHYPFLLSSDSHGTAQIGDFSVITELLQLADISKELILNSDYSLLKKFLNSTFLLC
ncbi:putative phosphatase YcdX [Eubacterium plexicaudatum ASF492]|uniref:Polymerase/histidinol phosphatase N-terminal domain-containing protein n=1 Tax=Eubacterium plexicaudatum ASF492 TaxID=1235802 RepID=N2AEH6_9FIRM|nr:putative phosphatase YcdX [Eubacterium plexicaudatum ASF492]